MSKYLDSTSHWLIDIDFTQFVLLPREEIVIERKLAYDPFSCVSFVRSKIASLPRGDAEFLRIDSHTEAVPGGVVKMAYRSKKTGELVYHLAYIKNYTKDGLIIEECNFLAPGVCGTREIKLSDPGIIGFWYPMLLT